MRLLGRIALVGIVGMCMAADPCVSGVPVGKRPGPYSFNIATGPERGEQFCYICETGENPGIIVFARSLDQELAKLLTEIDKEASPNPAEGGIRAWSTLLGEKFGLEEVADWSKKNAIRNLVMGTFDDPVGPPTYLLADDADITVLLFTKEKVVANFAFRDGELTDKAIDEVMKQVPKLKEE